MISPLPDDGEHRLDEVVDLHVARQVARHHRAEQEGAVAVEGIAVDVERDLEPAAEGDRPGQRQAARDRLRAHRQQPAHLALPHLVGMHRVEHQHLAQRRRALLARAVGQRQVVERQVVDARASRGPGSPPATPAATGRAPRARAAPERSRCSRSRCSRPSGSRSGRSRLVTSAVTASCRSAPAIGRLLRIDDLHVDLGADVAAAMALRCAAWPTACAARAWS